MLQQLDGGGTLFDFFGEAEIEKVFEVLGELGGSFEIRKTLRDDQKQRLGGGQIHIRWLSFKHLANHDSKTPNIHLCAVIMSLNQLRCHPIGRPYNCVSSVLLLRQLCRKSKIGQFDFGVVPKENVVGLNVSVEPMQAVHVAQRFQSLSANERDLRFAEHYRGELLEDSRQRSGSHILENNLWMGGEKAIYERE